MMAAIGGFPGDSTGRVELDAYGSIPPTDRRWSDADRELEETAAAAVHQAYLDTCARLGWPVKPANQVPYEELPEDAKELDRASVRAVRDALTAAGWRQTARPGCTCPTAGVLYQPGCTAHATTLTGEDHPQ